jgi:hypothetical protein
MPTVETNSPVEVEVNVTTEAPTIDVQIDGYLKSEMFVVDIIYRVLPSGSFDPPTEQWEMSATANEIADAVAHGKTVVGHRITSDTGALFTGGYVECLFDGVDDMLPTVSATFRDITTTGITSYTVRGASNVASVNTVPFSTEGGTLLVTFSHNGERWVADKTFAEVTAAIADGAYVYATDTNDTYYTLMWCDPSPNDGEVMFTSAGDQIWGVTLRHDEDVDMFATSFATETWVQNQGYLKQHQSLADYQTKAITDAGGYYTTDTVEGALQEIGAELAGINTLIGSGVIA